MNWTIQKVDAARSGLFADGSLVVTTDDGNEVRLLRLRDRLVARETPDVQVVATFRPTDPESLTDVDVIGLAVDGEEAYIAAIEAAGHRLLVFVRDYREARALELQPALLM